MNIHYELLPSEIHAPNLVAPPSLHKIREATAKVVSKEAYKEIGHTLKQAIDTLQKELSPRIKMHLEYRKIEETERAQVQALFEHYFTRLRSYADPILAFITPRIAEWNATALSTGRGFLIDSGPDLPCSILFSVKGECRLIFEDMGHLVGKGLSKVVLRSICLPGGEIQAVIKPGENTEENPFFGMWMEAEMLLKLKGETGIVNLHERMVFEWAGEKRLFLAEDYYWDDTLEEHLKHGIEISPAKQRQILTDLLHGLVAIHNHGIVHHDIKADNILLDLQKKEGVAAIADFHLATYVGDVARIEKIGLNPRWAAPEYAKIELDLTRPLEEIRDELVSVTTEKLDVWSMGLVFYSLITRDVPFWIKTDEESFFPLIAGLQKGWIPESLKSSPYYPLLEKMLKPDPAERCTARQALETLNKLH
jgi:hypothetical protein